MWAHRQAIPAGGGWVSDGEPVCDLFGFGLVYLPLGLVRCYLATRPEVTGNAEFSRWHHEHGHGPVPIHWDVRPVHLHY